MTRYSSDYFSILIPVEPDFRASGNRFIPLLDHIFALLTTPFPVPHPPAYQRLLRSYIQSLKSELKQVLQPI